jgi:3-hydroxyacyl-[acyl-carrier-protein] dehydratase
MDLKEIKTLLHHREPYLMVSEVIEHSQNQIVGVKKHSGDEPYINGHFPGLPVVPGAMIQELCTQSADILITKYHSPVENYHSEKTKGWALGVLNKVESAKYLDIVKPTSDIVAKVELVDHMGALFKFKAQVFQNDKLKAKLAFNLVNISDEQLK